MRILVAHDSARRRAQLEQLGLSLRACELSVISTASEVSQRLRTEHHDVVLLAAGLAARHHVDVARVIAATTSTTFILEPSAGHVAGSRPAMDAGPDAGGATSDRSRAIHELASVLRVFGGRIAPRPAMPVADRRRRDDPVDRQPTAPREDLTTAERDVLTGLAGGSTASRLAADLGLPEEAIDAHVASVLGKLHRRHIQPAKS